MSDKNVLLENLTLILTPDNFQKYILGTKSSGYPRAVYDVVKDFSGKGKKKKKKHKKKHKDDYDLSTVSGSYAFYLNSKGKKHKKKKSKYWHI